MKWIPPIPGGKLTSKPVRELGSAVVFLHWCYEAVRREDCSIEFQISDVAGYLDESYYTVRKWWSAVKDGPWFAEVTDRGKRGFRVRMADEWLEWRAFKSSSSDGQMHNPVLDENERAVNAPSIQNEMHNPVLEAPAYKVLQDDQNPPPPTTPQPARDQAGGGGGRRKPSDLERLFGSYGIGTAHDLADLYEREYPDLDLETIRQSCENVFERGHEHAAYRLMRRLKSSPPEPGKPYPRAGPHHTQQQTISAAAIPLIRAPDTPAPKYDPARAKAILDERLGKRS